jgi:ectoine hydroxylase-related dioxygenase (phytanoyl-CoA dioxygenase family)
MVTCRAGSAVIINQKVFHANYPNYSDNDRRMLAIDFRLVRFHVGVQRG